jgi:hypothetical protein
MQALRDWSFWRVVFSAGCWFGFWAVAATAWAAFQFGREINSSGSGGIGVVSFGLNEAVVWIVVLPPIILVVAWAMVRWFGRSPA